MNIGSIAKRVLPERILDSLFGVRWWLRPSPADTLKMCWRVRLLPNWDRRIPNGYSISDESADRPPDGWTDLLVSSGMTSSEKTWKREYVEHHCLAVFIVRFQQSVVGAAGLRSITGAGSNVVLNWVAIDPAHRGKGLAGILTRMAMQKAAEAGSATLFLATDDFRLPAIKTYVHAGFDACLTSWDRSHRWRWLRISKQLGVPVRFCTALDHAQAVQDLGF
jgi:ribosomal protein S18 acetylase RimI-like enzyme